MPSNTAPMRPADALPASRVGWILAAVQAVYYGTFVGLFTFSPKTLLQPIWPGSSITIALVYGLSIVLSTILLAGIYVLIANYNDRT